MSVVEILKVADLLVAFIQVVPNERPHVRVIPRLKFGLIGIDGAKNVQEIAGFQQKLSHPINVSRHDSIGQDVELGPYQIIIPGRDHVSAQVLEGYIIRATIRRTL